MEAAGEISADDWINKIWYIHRVEYYSAPERAEILSHTTTWVNLEGNYAK